jgi:hypothetical protein
MGRDHFENKPRRRWEDNINCELDLSDSGQRLVLGLCEHGNEPTGSIKVGSICWLAERLLGSQEGLCCMELVTHILSLDVDHFHSWTNTECFNWRICISMWYNCIMQMHPVLSWKGIATYGRHIVLFCFTGLNGDIIAGEWHDSYRNYK